MRFEVLHQAAGQSVADLQLDLMRENLSSRTYEGYPAQADRLVISPEDLQYDSAGRVILPDGPWNVDTHPNRRDTETEPTLSRQAELLEQGCVLDSRGRPLHPWFLKMLADPAIGAALGKGFNWEWGPNRTADSIILKKHQGQRHVLLIQRGDTGQRALPGGFIN